MAPRTNVVFLVTVVVLAGFGGFAGGPVTANDGQTAAGSVRAGSAQQLTGADAALDSGSTYWQGWDLSVDAGRLVDGGTGEIEIWLVTEDGRLSQRVATVSVDEEGSGALTTNRLRGRYVLRFNDQPVYLQDGTAYLSSPPDGSEVTIDSSAFRIERQTLTTEWSDPEVFPGQSSTLLVRSNRDSYVVAVSGPGLNFSHLVTLFPESVYAEDYDARADRDQLLVRLRSRIDVRLNTSVFSPETGSLTLDVVDTTARQSASLSVKAPSSNRRFTSVEWHENVGDVLEVEVACGSCHLVVGTPERGVIDVVELTDANGDGRITVLVNARYAALYTGASGYPGSVPQYTSPNDTIRRYTPGTTLEQVDEELSYTVDTLGKLRDELGLRSTGLHQPIEPGALQLTLASSDFLISRNAWGNRAPFGSRMVVRDETDARTVVLSDRSLTGVESMAAPGGSDAPTTLASVRASSAVRKQVALGDTLVFRIDVSGVFGYLGQHGISLVTLRDNAAEGLELSMVRMDGGGEPEDVSLDRTDVRFFADPRADAIYVTFRTGEGLAGALERGRYRLIFTLDGVASRFQAYSTVNSHTGYPYLVPGARERVEATVTIESPKATITDPAEGTTVRLTDSGGLVVRGTSTVAAGTPLRLHIASTEFAWESLVGTTVSPAGQWQTELDLSEAPGEGFTLTVIRDGVTLAQAGFTALPPDSESTPSGPGTDGGADGANGAGGSDGSGAGGDDGLGGVTNGDDGGIPRLAIYGGGLLLVVIIVVVGLVLR